MSTKGKRQCWSNFSSRTNIQKIILITSWYLHNISKVMQLLNKTYLNVFGHNLEAKNLAGLIFGICITAWKNEKGN